MEKKNVVIYVAGQRFSISTTDTEEYVIGIGEKVDVMIKGIQKDNPRLNRDACAILAALDICDDETKLRKMMEVLRSQVKDYLETNEALRAENAELRAKLKAMESSTACDTPAEEAASASSDSTAESTDDTADAEDADTSDDADVSPVPAFVSPVASRSEQAVAEAIADQSATRHTAFVGRDFAADRRKGKKHKNKHGKKNAPTPAAAPATAPAASVAEPTDEELATSAYHQYSIFDEDFN